MTKMKHFSVFIINHLNDHLKWIQNTEIWKLCFPLRPKLKTNLIKVHLSVYYNFYDQMRMNIFWW